MARIRAYRPSNLAKARIQEEGKVTPKYPHIRVELAEHAGNAYAVLEKVKKALQEGGAHAEEIANFMENATSGDYEQLLQVCMEWINIA